MRQFSALHVFKLSASSEMRVSPQTQTQGWARFMYEDKETLVEAGDVVHQRPGLVHYLFDYSPDMEYLENVGPADFKSIDAEGPCPVPDITPWK